MVLSNHRDDYYGILKGDIGPRTRARVFHVEVDTSTLLYLTYYLLYLRDLLYLRETAAVCSMQEREGSRLSTWSSPIAFLVFHP